MFSLKFTISEKFFLMKLASSAFLSNKKVLFKIVSSERSSNLAFGIAPKFIKINSNAGTNFCKKGGKFLKWEYKGFGLLFLSP